MEARTSLRKNAARVTFAGDWPACTSSQDYKAWREFAKRAVPRYNFCEDCTAEYQARMVREMRCENPHVRFGKDADGFVSGYSPSRHHEKSKEAADEIAG